jgi:serine/threonine protein phosphatase PrpC
LYARELGGWVRKTRDHTLLEQMVAAGTPPVDAESRRNFLGVILRTVGVCPRVEVETRVLPLHSAMDILLCTRGAWMPLDPNGDAQPLPGSLEPEHVKDFVLEHYRRDGERDNATLIVARVGA